MCSQSYFLLWFLFLFSALTFETTKGKTCQNIQEVVVGPGAISSRNSSALSVKAEDTQTLSLASPFLETLSPHATGEIHQKTA